MKDRGTTLVVCVCVVAIRARYELVSKTSRKLVDTFVLYHLTRLKARRRRVRFQGTVSHLQFDAMANPLRVHALV